MSAPSHVDNLDGNTLERAILRYTETLEGWGNLSEIAIATGYFNPAGFGRLRPALEKFEGVRLLIGAEPLPAGRGLERRLGEPTGADLEHMRARQVLEDTVEKVKRDLDRMPFTKTTDRHIRGLLEFLESGRIEVRRYGRRFLHGKAYLFSEGRGVIAGSSNFTAAGLTTNLELNLGHYDPEKATRVQEWFDRLWDDAEPYDLADIYRARFKPYDPHLIYLRALWELYGEELDAERDEFTRIRLTRFQTEGVARAKRILEQYNGVIVADSVGLGKSFIAADIFTEVIEQRRQRALLIAPAQLRDGMWGQFKATYQSGVEVISYEQLAADRQLGEGDGAAISSEIDDYSLIVIDEAQAFRNPDTKRARALRRLLQGDPPKKCLMLSATPVNNSLWDLYDLLNYFLEHDAVFADRGIPSLKRRFEQAASMDPFTLKPDVLFDVLDQTTVRRTRQFVKTYFPNDHFEMKDGTRVTIRFPEPTVRALNYDLEEVLPGFFEEFARALDPERDGETLTLARYQQSRYLGGEAGAREAALLGLIRSGLLKRFESSSRAFVETLDRMIHMNEDFIRSVESGVIPSTELLQQLQETDSDEAWDELLTEGGDPIPTEGTDVEGLIRDVKRDNRIMNGLRDAAVRVSPAEDPKLELLVEELARIADEARREGTTEQDVRNRRKVIVFSYFADTVDWIAKHLRGRLEADPRLHDYRDRIAVVAGSESQDGMSRADAVFGFAPETSDAPPGRADDRFDILVTTDVLAEGMNLQQAGRILNYDLPWNPMRLVQRHGRVDRIGSPHPEVELMCIFPDRQLDELLALEQRIRRKLAHAAASIGLAQEVIPGTEVTQHVFADERDQIERLRRGDATLFEQGGDPHALSGEAFRQELRKGVELREQRILGLPWGAGSGIRSDGPAGFVFCARVFDHTFFRFVPLEPPEPEGEDGEDGEEEEDGILRDTLACLALFRCEQDTERYLPDEFADRVFGAWQLAREDIYREWTWMTDPKNLQPDVRPLLRKAAEHVRRHPAPEFSREELDRVADALEAPRSIRQERQIRDALDAGDSPPAEATRRVVHAVRDLGLQPFQAPEPRDPIEPDEVNLVVWMGIVGANGRDHEAALGPERGSPG